MREVTVDASRFLCFSAVVFLHFFSYSRADPLQISSIVDNLTRFAVPVFFMITGYLLYSSGRKSDELIKIYFVRLFVIFVFWEVVYYAIDAWIVAIRPSTYEVRSAFDEILWIFYTGGIAFHLWFVPWLFVSVAIFVLLKSAVPRIWLYLIGVVSFAIGLALGPYNMESNLSGTRRPIWSESGALHSAQHAVLRCRLLVFWLLVCRASFENAVPHHHRRSDRRHRPWHSTSGDGLSGR